MMPLKEKELSALMREYIDVDGMKDSDARALAEISVRLNPWPAISERLPILLAAMAEYDIFKTVPIEARDLVDRLSKTHRLDMTLSDLWDVISLTDFFNSRCIALKKSPFYRLIAAGSIPKHGPRYGRPGYQAKVVEREMGAT